MNKKQICFTMLLLLLFCPSASGSDQTGLTPIPELSLAPATQATSVSYTSLTTYVATSVDYKRNAPSPMKNKSSQYAGMNLFFNVNTGPLPATIVVVLVGLATAVMMRPRR